MELTAIFCDFDYVASQDSGNHLHYFIIRFRVRIIQVINDFRITAINEVDAYFLDQSDQMGLEVSVLSEECLSEGTFWDTELSESRE